MSDDVRSLVWKGSLNIQVEIDSALLFDGVPDSNRTIHFWMLRNCYITSCLDAIFGKTLNLLKAEPGELYPHIWFEYENVALPWNIPLGVLYDSHHMVRHPYPEQLDAHYINLWEIRLRYSETLPTNVIPIIDGEEQTRRFVMHQWKQSCFVLNGSAKQVMSLSVDDTDRLWRGLSDDDTVAFNEITRRIIPNTPRRIPLIVLDSRADPLRITQPKVKSIPLAELFIQFNTDKVTCQGISITADQITAETDLFQIYKLFYSFDGFLYIVL